MVVPKINSKIQILWCIFILCLVSLFYYVNENLRNNLSLWFSIGRNYKFMKSVRWRMRKLLLSPFFMITFSNKGLFLQPCDPPVLCLWSCILIALGCVVSLWGQFSMTNCITPPFSLIPWSTPLKLDLQTWCNYEYLFNNTCNCICFTSYYW